VLALAMRRNARWTIQLSRKAAFQSMSLVAVGFYLLAMLAVGWAVETHGGAYSRAATVVSLFAMSVVGLLLLPSDRFRGWLRVTLAKHFFAHRYDYRDEWMRFTDTIGRSDGATGPLELRVLKAVCDICESPAGLLIMPDGNERFRIASRWRWECDPRPGDALSKAAICAFERDRFILDLDNLRRGVGQSAAFPDAPQWAVDDRRAWIMVPLAHLGRLVGVALLARPKAARALDWEDLDMLRVASAQAGSYLAEWQNREALMEMRHFDEFNRRFAFIMHDIKNLVSQLSLVARNAERHADNPEFRADMVATLQSSVGKMNELLARLSQHHKGKVEPPRRSDIVDVARTVAQGRIAANPIAVVADAPVHALADPARLETILGHLLQNAVDASDAGAPIEIVVGERGDMAAIAVVDTGHGMSEDFVSTKLFKAFSSDKEGGFGVGAYEAQMLARAMGGRIEVESRPGVGSRFTVLLPLAPADAGHAEPAENGEKAA
jgi:putative PEP-CTERM system histidine kinase